MATHSAFFNEHGYCVIDVLNDGEHQKVMGLIHSRVSELYSAISSGSDFPGRLEDYHATIGQSDETHRALMNPMNRYIEISEDLKQKIFAGTFREVLTHVWGNACGIITLWIGRYPEGRRADEIAMFRITRPHSKDAVSPHVDKNYGGLANAGFMESGSPPLLTLWIPVCGFDARYTLPVCPGSHLIAHPDSAFKVTNERITMEFDESYIASMDFVRPTLRVGQGLILHPNLVHGGGANIGDETRVSLELRIMDANRIDAIYGKFSQSEEHQAHV